MKEKKYRSIQEVSDLLDIKAHVIRYWDSRINGISTRISKNKQRFFSIENIRKLEELKKNIYQNGKHIYSLDLANKLLEKKKNVSYNKVSKVNYENNDDLKKKKTLIESLYEIRNNLKKLIIK